MHGLTINGELKFIAGNLRTGFFGEVVVWGSPNGGSSGDAHGRFNAKPVAAAAGQWNAGDMLVPLDGHFCGEDENEGQLIQEWYCCHVPILSVDHNDGSNGVYFNFKRSLMHGLTINGELKFIAGNLRTGFFGEVVVWGSPNGGSSGDAHGRFNAKPVAAAAGQWKAGDMLVPLDGRYHICGTDGENEGQFIHEWGICSKELEVYSTASDGNYECYLKCMGKPGYAWTKHGQPNCRCCDKGSAQVGAGGWDFWMTKDDEKLLVQYLNPSSTFLNFSVTKIHNISNIKKSSARNKVLNPNNGK